MTHLLHRVWLIILATALLLPSAALARPPLILAAASLQESLESASSAWTAKGHERPILSFAASSALARQIASGAPADLFLSADEEWMDYVQARNRIVPGTRTSFLYNQLVLIAPVASPVRLSITPRLPLARALGTGRLAMADPAAVPAGKYGKAALEKLGVWASVSGKVASAENVRAALALVERNAAPLGIVYATDAKASTKVRVVGTFPTSSHAPISYPIARLATSSSADAEGFRRFLLSREGRVIFARHGFVSK